jgi:hypothetical protein
MWALLEPMLIKFTVEEMVALLVKSGILPEIAGDAITDIEGLRAAVSNISFTYTYPTGKNGQ